MQSSSRVKSSYNSRSGNKGQKRAEKSQKTYKRLQEWNAAMNVLREKLKAGIGYD